MSGGLPEGEDLRRAVRWVSQMRTEQPEAPLVGLVEKACVQFDLSPRDESFLLNFFTREQE